MSDVKKSKSEVNIFNGIEESEKKKKFSKLVVGDWFSKENLKNFADGIEIFVKTSDDDEDGDINAFSFEDKEVSIDPDEKIYPIRVVEINIS
jgi:hypothetical protein